MYKSCAFNILCQVLSLPYTCTQVGDTCSELTSLVRESEDAMLAISRGPSPPFDDFSEREVGQLSSMSDAVHMLEDVLNRKQYLKAIQLLHTIRKNWRDEEMFGTGEGDDVQCLFFIYAHFITNQQQGRTHVLRDCMCYFSCVELCAVGCVQICYVMSFFCRCAVYNEYRTETV